MIKAVTFDFWDTLYPSLGSNGDKSTAEFRAEVLHKFFLEHGKEFTIEEARAAYDCAEREHLEHWHTNLRQPQVKKAIDCILGSLNEKLNADQRLELAVRLRLKPEIDCIEPCNGVPELLAELSQRFRLGIISDTWLTPGEQVRQLMRKHSLLKCFSATVFSDETGFLKPHPRQFRIALQAVGTEAGETVHVGDSEARDVIGAKQLGMKTVLLDHACSKEDSQADAIIAHISRFKQVIRELSDK